MCEIKRNSIIRSKIIWFINRICYITLCSEINFENEIKSFSTCVECRYLYIRKTIIFHSRSKRNYAIQLKFAHKCVFVLPLDYEMESTHSFFFLIKQTHISLSMNLD